ncbi:MAG: hypothetical protein R2754_17930 [Microthrixaceae bacterium]|jgi:hypothetical protein
MLLAQTHVWHYWVAMVLAISAVLLAVTLGVGYLRSVVKPRYPGPRD